MNDQTIGQTIKQIRINKDLSVSALAKLSGCSKSYLSEIESGKYQNISLDIAIRISNALGIKLNLLIGTRK